MTAFLRILSAPGQPYFHIVILKSWFQSFQTPGLMGIREESLGHSQHMKHLLSQGDRGSLWGVGLISPHDTHVGCEERQPTSIP